MGGIQEKSALGNDLVIQHAALFLLNQLVPALVSGATVERAGFQLSYNMESY